MQPGESVRLTADGHTFGSAVPNTAVDRERVLDFAPGETEQPLTVTAREAVIPLPEVHTDLRAEALGWATADLLVRRAASE